MRISDWSSDVCSSDLSSETVLFKAMWKEEGVQRERDLVARIQRQTICPMLADVFFQYNVMKAIGENSDTAIPNIPFVERTGAVLDETFFLMDRVEGRVPTDFPGFHGEGWVFDLPDEDRTRLWWNGIKEMEKLHRIGWEKFTFLAKGTKERPGYCFSMKDFMQTRPEEHKSALQSQMRILNAVFGLQKK